MADWPAGCDPYWSDQMGVPGKVCLNSAGKFIDIPSGIVATPARETSSVLNNLAAFFGGNNTLKAAEPFDPLKWLGEGYNAIYVALGALGFVLLLGMAKGGRR